MTAHRTKRMVTLGKVLWFVFATILLIQVYLLLHEFGHALAALAVGGTVTEIDARVWSSRPHASYVFGDVTSAQQAFVSAAGSLLPLLVWAAMLLALPRRLPPHLAIFRFAASGSALAGQLPWLILPWPAFHASSSGDDVVRFTQSSGWSPALVVAVAAAILVGGVALFWWRVGGADGLRSLRKVRVFEVPRGAVHSTTAVLVALILTTVGLAAWSAQGSEHDGVGVPLPEGPALADITLDGAAFDATFARGVADVSHLALVIGYEGIDGGPFGLILVDGEGREHSLGGFGEGTTMGVASSRPRLVVAEGPWVVRLRAEKTVGRFRLWLEEDPLPEGGSSSGR